MNEDLVTISRLALAGNEADIRLFLAKFIRKMKKIDPDTTTELEKLLKQVAPKRNSILRKNVMDSAQVANPFLNVASEEVFKFLKVWDSTDSLDSLLLSDDLESSLGMVVEERSPKNIEIFKKNNLKPVSSIIFQGPPGVGKSLTAKWLAKKLNLPLYILDLSSVMSSYMGKTGNNLRQVLDFAKSIPCVLFLDEIDAIAKKRGDNSDVGELKRLVTVLLQEIENWPDSGMLIAATNHQELLDPALWRRFDLDLNFGLPSEAHIQKSLEVLFDKDYKFFKSWEGLLKVKFQGLSYSLIKREVNKLRKIKLMYEESLSKNMILEYLISDISKLSKQEQIQLSVDLVMKQKLSQLQVSNLTGISRDTLRKKIAQSKGDL